MFDRNHPYEPLTSENAALVLVDHQVGLMTGVRDYSTGELKHNVVGLAKAAKALRLPIVVTTTYLDIPPDHITQKVRTLIATAKQQGAAVAAAHISTGAPEVVRSMLPEFGRVGIVFVPITEFLARRAP